MPILRRRCNTVPCYLFYLSNVGLHFRSADPFTLSLRRSIKGEGRGGGSVHFWPFERCGRPFANSYEEPCALLRGPVWVALYAVPHTQSQYLPRTPCIYIHPVRHLCAADHMKRGYRQSSPTLAISLRVRSPQDSFREEHAKAPISSLPPYSLTSNHLSSIGVSPPH